MSASQLDDYDRCGLQYAYRRDKTKPRVQGSAAAYGTVMHHGLHVMERAWAEPAGNGVVDQAALAQAIATFEHYWHPQNIGQLTEPVQEWQRGHDWAGLKARGGYKLTAYADRRANDDAVVLALEYPFEVPVVGTRDEITGEPHTISGYIDKLAVRRYYRKPYLSSDDYKTGKTKSYLRHHVQGHTYCYAPTRKEFWTGFGERGPELYDYYFDLPKRFRWESLSDDKYADTWRGEQDWRRLALMVDAVAAAVQRGIFIPTLDGSTCNYCDYTAICGDTPLPADDHGRPAVLR